MASYLQHLQQHMSGAFTHLKLSRADKTCLCFPSTHHTPHYAVCRETATWQLELEMDQYVDQIHEHTVISK